MFAAQWIGGNPRSGLVSLGIMAAFGTFILFGGRSETVRGLRGDGRDERFWQMDLVATAISGMTVIAVIVGAFVVDLARGHDGSPYGLLGAVAGVSYVAAIVVLRLRS